MDLDDFIRVRPFAYHTTARSNLLGIMETRELISASTLFGAGEPRIRERRLANVPVTHDGRAVVIRSQAPLVAGNIDFEDDWDLARFVEHLNSFVYFWPGTEIAPRPNGVRHFHQNAAGGEVLTILRAPTADLFIMNSKPQFSRCNSGSPRMSGGVKCPRGGKTFLPASAFAEPPSRAVELVFPTRATLPASTTYSGSLAGPWSPLRMPS